ncbi:unnamed protein product, partial [Rotaria magnacalcarata]
MYRVGEETSPSLPRIPAQPIGYGEALVILKYLQGSEVAADWCGTLSNIRYRYGGVLLNAS